MDGAFFKWLSSQYCESCLLLNLLASERLLDRLKGSASYKVLQGNEGQLEILDLSECSLNDNDAQVLAALLVKEDTVKGVDLSLNQIGDAGAVALSELLIPNGFVSQLNLSENSVAEIGGLAFCNALSRKSEAGGVDPVVSLKQNPLPLNVSDLVNSYTKKDDSSVNVSIASLLRPELYEANDFSSEEEEVVNTVPRSSPTQTDEEEEQVLEKYVRSGLVESDLEIDVEVLQLPEYSLDLEEIARKDFLESGVRELLIDTDELNLSNLSVSLVDFEAKLQSIQTCNISMLDLSSNNLDGIPSYLPQGLRKLFMKENRIREIENLFNCPHLQVLNLEQNRIGVSGDGFLPGLCLLDLSELSLADNSLSELDILNSIGPLQKLKKLDLRRNSLEPLEIITQMEQTHSSSLSELFLTENAGNYSYEEIAREKLPALRTLNGVVLSERSPTKKESKVSKLFNWRVKRKQQSDQSNESDALAPQQPEDENASSSAGVNADEFSHSSHDFGDFALLSARLGILELPHERSTFSYFAKTSEYLNEMFHDLDQEKKGYISGKEYALGFDKIQRQFSDHVSQDIRRRSISSIVDSRVNIQEYLANSSLRQLFGRFSKREVEGHPVTNGYMTFLDLLRWIDTCFINGASKKTSSQQRLIVSFFTRERRIPKFNFLDFVFSIFFVCTMTKVSADKIVRHVVKSLKHAKPVTLASADEMMLMSLDTLKANHISDVSTKGKEKWPRDASQMYRNFFLKGFPIEKFMKHKDTNLLLTVLEIAVEEQEKFLSADHSRILQLRKDLSNATKQIKLLGL